MTFDLDLYLQGHSALFWLGIQHDSIVWVIMRRQGVSSERRRSSCSSCRCLRLSICPSFPKLYLITDLSWDHQICTKHASLNTLGWYWKWSSLTLTFKVILTFGLRILGNMACPHDNSSQIWARITKLAPNMHPGKLGWYWKWRSLTLTFKVILAILTQNCEKCGFVCVITHHRFGLESPNLQ